MNVKLQPVGDFAGIEIDGKFMFTDIYLGEKMGLARPRDIRRTIAKYRSWLEDYGLIQEGFEKARIGSAARRTINVRYLSEWQALSLCVLMKTGKARAVHADIVRFCQERRRREEEPKAEHPVLAASPSPATAVPGRVAIPATRTVSDLHVRVMARLTKAIAGDIVEAGTDWRS